MPDGYLHALAGAGCCCICMLFRVKQGEGWGNGHPSAPVHLVTLVAVGFWPTLLEAACLYVLSSGLEIYRILAG